MTQNSQAYMQSDTWCVKTIAQLDTSARVSTAASQAVYALCMQGEAC